MSLFFGKGWRLTDIWEDFVPVSLARKDDQGGLFLLIEIPLDLSHWPHKEADGMLEISHWLLAI